MPPDMVVLHLPVKDAELVRDAVHNDAEMAYDDGWHETARKLTGLEETIEAAIGRATGDDDAEQPDEK